MSNHHGVVLARHGETNDNRPPIRVQGFTDTPLNEVGRAQARERAERVAGDGFKALWEAVTADFVARRAAGGLRISINDGGARPDTVSLRLAQGVRLIEEAEA